MSQASPAPSNERCYSPRDRRNQLLLAGICLLWALLFTGAMYVIELEILPAGPISWIVAALPTAAGVVVLFAFVRFLRESDELQRLIQLQALALGFGGGFFVLCGYALFEQLGAPKADGPDLAAVMPVLYAIGVLVGQRRYR